MKNSIPILGLFLIVCLSFSTSSCAGLKMKKLLKGHQSDLAKAAMNNISPEEKFDILATSFANVLDEALAFPNPKRSLKYVEEYAAQNKKSIELITKSSTNHIDTMSDTKKILFATSLATKPYTKQLINNIPKYEKKIGRKITAIKFLGKLGDFFKPGQLFRF